MRAKAKFRIVEPLKQLLTNVLILFFIQPISIHLCNNPWEVNTYVQQSMGGYKIVKHELTFFKEMVYPVHDFHTVMFHVRVEP